MSFAAGSRRSPQIAGSRRSRHLSRRFIPDPTADEPYARHVFTPYRFYRARLTRCLAACSIAPPSSIASALIVLAFYCNARPGCTDPSSPEEIAMTTIRAALAVAFAVPPQVNHGEMARRSRACGNEYATGAGTFRARISRRITKAMTLPFLGKIPAPASSPPGATVHRLLSGMTAPFAI